MDFLRSQQKPGVQRAIDHEKDLADLEAAVMTQYGMKKGLEKFGQKGVDAVEIELKQLHDRKVVKPTNQLSYAQKKASLEYLMFLKEK